MNPWLGQIFILIPSTSVGFPTGVSPRAGVKVPLLSLSRCFVQLRHRLEVVHQDSSQLVVELAVNLFLSSQAARGEDNRRADVNQKATQVPLFFSPAAAARTRTCSGSTA